MLVRGNTTRVVYKRFNRKKWLDPLLTLFRPSRAWRSWQAGQHLVSRGIPTPQNLAFLSRRRSFSTDRIFWFLPHETYLITVKEDHVVDLATYARKVLANLAPRSAALGLLPSPPSLAQLVRSLHERSLSHRDLKAANILINSDSIDGGEQLSLIDLVGVRLRHPLPWSRRVQNLARLCISLDAVAGRTRSDSLRFLRLYLPWGLSPLNDWKKIWRSIEKGIRHKRSRNRRRGARFPKADGSRVVTGGLGHGPIERRRLLFALGATALLLSATSCATLSDRGRPLVPTRYQMRSGPFIIFSNFPMNDDPPALRCLQALERDMKKHLDFTPRLDTEPVEIYVLDDRDAFAHFLQFYYPELPPRRAFFLAQGSQRSRLHLLEPAARGRPAA